MLYPAELRGLALRCYTGAWLSASPFAVGSVRPMRMM